MDDSAFLEHDLFGRNGHGQVLTSAFDEGVESGGMASRNREESVVMGGQEPREPSQADRAGVVEGEVLRESAEQLRRISPGRCWWLFAVWSTAWTLTRR